MVTPTNDQDRLIDQALSLLRNAMAETKTVLPVVQFRPAEPKALLPSSVQEERAASLVNQTLPMVENIALSEAPSPSLQQPVTKQASKDVLPTEPPVQEEQTPSLIDQTLFMVEQSLQQPVANQKEVPPPEPPVQEERTASLIGQKPSMVEIVAVAEPKPVEAAPPIPQQPIVKQPTPKERLDMERAEIRTRVATFKANQQRFQRE